MVEADINTLRRILKTSRVIAVVGFAGLIVLGAGIVLWRTEQLRASLGL